MENFNELVERIAAHSKLDRESIERLVEDKKQELSGLVSKEGAAYIVGRELGISLVKEGRRDLKVKTLMAGLRNVDIELKIVRVYDARNWEKEGKKGKVCNLLVGDETGLCRLSLWNEEVEMVEGGRIKEGDSIRISNGYVLTDNRGNPELRVGKGKIKRIEKNIDVPQSPRRTEISDAFSSQKRQLDELKEGDYFTIRASILQLFSRKPFYEVCPECGIRMEEKEGKFICSDHPGREPKYNLLAAGFIDDGTACMRAVMFREAAQKIYGGTAEEVVKLFEGGNMSSGVTGKEFIFTGQAKKSDFTGDVELVVNEVQDFDTRSEAARLTKEIESVID